MNSSEHRAPWGGCRARKTWKMSRMAVRIRLKRMGRKKAPHYRVVVADANSPRDGRFVETLGYYKPLSQPARLVLDLERVDYWIGQGASASNTVSTLIDKARTGGDDTVALGEEDAEAKKKKAADALAARQAEKKKAEEEAAAAKAAEEAAAAEAKAAEEAAAEAKAAEESAAEGDAAAEAEEAPAAEADEAPAAEAEEAPAEEAAAEETGDEDEAEKAD